MERGQCQVNVQISTYFILKIAIINYLKKIKKQILTGNYKFLIYFNCKYQILFIFLCKFLLNLKFLIGVIY